MRKVTCAECGKHYDYDIDDFCPKCGAFNRPATYRTPVVEGINESNHQGSFLHAELHAENRARHGSTLEHDVRQVPQGKETTGASFGVFSSGNQSKKPTADIKKIVGYIVAAIVILNLFASLLPLLLGF